MGPSSGLAQDPPTAQGRATLRRGATVGRYVILYLVGAGSIGVVYAAYDPELDRKIALKLLHTSVGSSSLPEELRARLLREARAMARVSHPNVVAVYDAGTFGDLIFVAMEFVEGMTLKRWAREEPRSRREIVAVFAAAGRGLAAAHAAGLVHRDFKPDNVLIGRDGRVCVGDFGLARPEAQLAEEPRPPPREPSTDGQTLEDTLTVQVTRTGALVGTPAYMAPEQLHGGKVDARADQFSFAVALYELLNGTRPFAGESLEQITQSMRQGPLRAVGRSLSAPPRVQRVLLRALQTDPAHRYSSMADLLSHLERNRAVIWRRAALIVGALALGATALLYASQPEGAFCGGGEQRLTGIWDGPRKQAIRTAFLSTGKPYAPDVWSGVEHTLDAYAQRWVAMHSDACEATRRRGEQSERLLDLRMQCLGERLKRMQALSDLFARADDKVVTNAVQAAYALVDVSGCADARALTTGVPPPDPAIRGKVAELEARLAQAGARLDAGKYREGLRIARPIAEEARPLRYRPLEAEALWILGELLERTGDLKAAEKTLLEGVQAADAARRDEVGALARIALVQVVGNHWKRYAEGHVWARFAAAAIERLPPNPRMRARLLGRLGALLADEGRYFEAVAQQERAVALLEESLGSEHPDIATLVNGIGATFSQLRRSDQALPYYERALAIRTKVLGPTHPAVAASLNNVGLALGEADKDAQALPYFRRALSIMEKAHGPKHPYVGLVRNNLTSILSSLGRYDEALAESRRALAVRESIFGPDHPDVAVTVHTLANLLFNQKRFDEALVQYRRARTIFERKLGPTHPDLAILLSNMATARIRKGQPEKALPLARRALYICEKMLGPKHRSAGQALTAIGRAHLALKAPDLAAEALQRALTAYSEAHAPDAKVAEAEFLLARALWGAKRDQSRAIQLAEHAASLLPRAESEDRREIAAWLRQNARRR
jgi:tetratricopeptide (TPR) repeat protein